jgi:ABC-type nitrate/sulfonate/bicarbonate transport system substrate-binding protein
LGLNKKRTGGTRLKNRTLLAALLCACLAPTGMAAAQAITVGATSSTSDAPIFIADRKG